ncbi:MAG: TatD family hydrolase [Sphaerochaetaceae bacterium]|nr:TatD family hydrolase [Sphaerochaetaceae bacterium]
MKGIFDTHCHYDEFFFEKDRNEVLLTQNKNGIELIINCGSEVPSSIRSCKLAEKYPFIYATVGVFPLEASKVSENWLQEIEELAKKEKVVAIGEIGLDYFLSRAEKEIQKEVFIKQLALAEKLGLPVEIHDRDADEDVLSIIDKFNLKVDIHRIFSEEKYSRAFVERGYYLGIGPQITYPNSEKLINIVREMPMKQMLLETDCPFLPLKEFEGTRAVSSMLEDVAFKISEIRKDITPQEVIEVTKNNGKRLFGIK